MSPYLSVQPQLSPSPWHNLFTDIHCTHIIKLSMLRFGYNRLPPHLKRVNVIQADLRFSHPHSPHRASLNYIFFRCLSLENLRLQLYYAALTVHLPSPFSAIDYYLSVNYLSVFVHVIHFISQLPSTLPI